MPKPRSHGPLLATALLVLAAAAWWWQPWIDPVPMRTPRAPAPATLPAPPAAAASAAREAAPLRAAAAGPAAPTTPTPTAGTTAAGTPIHGTITVRDERGVEHATTDGSLQVEFLVATAADRVRLERQSVAVTAGRWQAVAPPDTGKVRAQQVDLDGRAALCRDEVELPPPGQPIALRAQWLAPHFLVRVLADDTGLDLADLRVVRMCDWQRERCPHPGNRNVHEVLAGGRSPLRLQNDHRGSEDRFWIRAPGYAWNHIAIATTEPGEHLLRLRPGGDVDVVVVGGIPAGSVLRARPADRATGQPAAELHPAAEGATRIDGLAAGGWVLALEKGGFYGDRVVLGQTTAAIAAATITTATITLTSAPERPATFAVGGTLRVSPQWGADLLLAFEPTGSLRAWHDRDTTVPLADMQRLADGEYRWGPCPLPAGRWELTVRGCEHRVVLEVGPAHPTEVAIVAPDPNDVRVRILDATDGQPVTKAAPGWYGLPDDWQSGWTHVPMQELGDGWYGFRAPAGRLQISVHPEGYAWSMSQHVVQPGANEFVVRITRVCGVEVVLQDGEVTLPWPDDARVELEHVVSRAGVAYWSGNRVAAVEPGEHVLTIQPIDGFLPIPPRRVVIEPAKWTRVEIGLQRKP